MSEAGGPTTQFGVRLQNTVAAFFLARMLYQLRFTTPGESTVLRVRSEAPVEVDDVVVHLVGSDGTAVTHYIQVKAALATSDDAWDKMWHHFLVQARTLAVGDRLILWGRHGGTPFKRLSEIVQRAQSVPERLTPAEQEAEFNGRLNAEQRQLVEAIERALALPASSASSPPFPRHETIALLRRVDVETMGSAEHVEERAYFQFLAPIGLDRAVFATLRDLAGGAATTRRELTVDDLLPTLPPLATASAPPFTLPARVLPAQRLALFRRLTALSDDDLDTFILLYYSEARSVPPQDRRSYRPRQRPDRLGRRPRSSRCRRHRRFTGGVPAGCLTLSWTSTRSSSP